VSDDKPLVDGVRAGADCQQLPVSPPHPRDLQQKERQGTVTDEIAQAVICLFARGSFAFSPPRENLITKYPGTLRGSA